MKSEYSNIIALIDNLTVSIKNGNIGDDERAQACAMKKSLIDKFITEHHHNKISTYTTRKGDKEYTTYTTRVPGLKTKISAQSEDLLKEKLYEHYAGKSIMDTATFASIFSEALNWHSA